MQKLPTEVTLIESSGCHLCADAHVALEDLGTRYRLTLRSVDASSPEGLELVIRHRPALQPLVLVNGKPFSAGRLPRRKLERYLSGTGRRHREAYAQAPASDVAQAAAGASVSRRRCPGQVNFPSMYVSSAELLRAISDHLNRRENTTR